MSYFLRERNCITENSKEKNYILEAKAHTKLVHNISDSINSYPKKKNSINSLLSSDTRYS